MSVKVPIPILLNPHTVSDGRVMTSGNHRITEMCFLTAVCQAWMQRGTLLNAAVSFCRRRALNDWSISNGGGRSLSVKRLTKPTKLSCRWTDIKNCNFSFSVSADQLMGWELPWLTDRDTCTYGCLDTLHPLMPSWCAVETLSQWNSFSIITELWYKHERRHYVVDKKEAAVGSGVLI